MQPTLAAILPCNDIDRTEAFFARFGFKREEGGTDDYRMLADGFGGHIHLNPAVEVGSYRDTIRLRFISTARMWMNSPPRFA